MMNRHSSGGRLFASVLGIVSLGAGARLHAQTMDPSYDVKEHYVKSSYMVPMRDGVKLFTIVYTPKDSTQNVPIMLFRTPYSIPPYEPDKYKTLLGPSQEFDKDGYIFVFQDARGKFRSEGVFEVGNPYKPVKKTKMDVDESSDTYDTIDWLLKNARHHNGRVGMWGISYPGWQTAMGIMEAHPALKAASPQASPADMFIGDDFHHNGAFRFQYAFSWLAGNARTRAGSTTERGPAFDYGTPDGYRFFMNIGTPARVDSLYFHGNVPAWNDFMNHPNYDGYWQKQNVEKDMKNIKPAILNVAGWFDAEDFYGPMSIYRAIEKNNPGNKSTLVVGPWLHGGWSRMKGDTLGSIRFASNTGEYFRENVQYPFFNYYLRDKGDWKGTEAIVFETGRNVWKTYDTWPPKNAVATSLYFQANGKLSFDPPKDTPEPFDSYTSDPNKPVPFSAETRNTNGHLWMVEDQRFAAARADVLVYETEPLTEDVTVAGPVIASLNVATSGTDSDWIVKLVDVYPGNAPDNVPNLSGVRMGDFQMLVGADVFRSKYRNSYTTPEPMVPNQVTKIEYDIRDKYHTFLKGHRIMVQVQSSWFPVIDRNPGKFMDIYHAQPSDFQKTTQKVYRSPQYPSKLVVRLLKEVV
jgi:putative CocE/NonD family hydrolase